MTEPDNAPDSLDDREIDRIASRLEDQLKDIEAARIDQGLTPETLEGKGFTGSGPVPIERAGHPDSQPHPLPSDADCQVVLRTSKGGMSVWMDCTPASGRGLPLTPEHVRSVLAKEGICYGLQEDKIRESVLMANESRLTQTEVLVAAGLPPVKGKDGEAEFKFAVDGRKQEFRILPDGRIDYKNSVNILMAKKGDLLAVLRDPGKGTAGMDVMGQPVPAQDGEPMRLTAGQGVRQSPDGNAFYATVNGNIVLNNTMLEIMEFFVVNSDVDFSTGNIQFNGNVVINGDIKEGFEVQATGDIIVMKNIESSRVSAGRDVKVTGGIVSKGAGLVSAGRDIMADYAQNARLEAQGNVFLENFSVNSMIFTSRFLRMQSKRGTVLGGEIFAQKGVDVKVLGSENGKKTFVEVGTDFLVRKKKIELEEALKFTESTIAKIDHALRPLVDIARTHPALFAAKKLLVQKTMAKKKEFETQRAAMTVKLEDLNRRVNDPDPCYVKVRAVCYPDVQIKIREQRLYVSKRLDRKMFMTDSKTGEIKVASCA